MKICGFNKTTLLDYPGHVAATIFLGGCNFRCPFCQNKELVLNPEQAEEIQEEVILHTLEKRKGVLTGVCITGGEPTLCHELLPFCKKIKEKGMKVKLDTNGYRPEVIKQLVEEKLIDYIAMDVKSSYGEYGKVTGVAQIDIKKIKKSIDFIMGCGVEYEFRTTVVRELHSKDDFIKIRDFLAGSRRYFLQAYRDDENVINRGYHAYSKEEMEEFAQLLREKIQQVEIRGIE